MTDGVSKVCNLSPEDPVSLASAFDRLGILIAPLLCLVQNMERLLIVVGGSGRRNLILVGMEHFQLPLNLFQGSAFPVFQILLLLRPKSDLPFTLFLPLSLT